MIRLAWLGHSAYCVTSWPVEPPEELVGRHVGEHRGACRRASEPRPCRPSPPCPDRNAAADRPARDSRGPGPGRRSARAMPVVTVTRAPMASVLPLGSLATTVSQWFMGVAAVVAQQARRVVEVDDQEVEVAVVVEVAPGRAPADELLGEVGARPPGHVDEIPLAVVVRHHGSLAVFVVGVAVGDEQVEVAVVVEVLKHRAPAGVLAADQGEPGGVGLVLEVSPRFMCRQP